MASEQSPESGLMTYRTVIGGVLIAGVAAAVGTAVESSSDKLPIQVAAALLGIAGMIVAGFAISCRPKDSLNLLLASLAAILAGVATNSAWDSIRLMQWVMAGTAAAVALIVLLPQTGQRIAFSLLVIYHFAGICSAITSPPPTPWLTGQLWTRIFRPHLEFSYVNNAYQFYSPQPGPAQVLWFCITGTDGVPRWYKTPVKGEMLDPLGIEYFRRLSLTERANQNSPNGPATDVYLRRKEQEGAYKFHPEIPETLQYRAPNEHGRHIIEGYARHAARVLGTGRRDADGKPVPVHDVKVYLTQHEMLSQLQFQNKQDPYAPETYRPFFVGQFDGEGRPLMNDFDRVMLYWIVPIIRTPAGDKNGTLNNLVILHAGSDPFDPDLQWRSGQ
jgi:hypothetical protein